MAGPIMWSKRFSPFLRVLSARLRSVPIKMALRGSLHCHAIVPWHPVGRFGRKLLGMPLPFSEIVKGIHIIQHSARTFPRKAAIPIASRCAMWPFAFAKSSRRCLPTAVR